MVQEKPKAKVDKCCQSGQAEYNNKRQGSLVKTGRVKTEDQQRLED